MFSLGADIGAAKSKGLNIILRHKFLQCYSRFNIYTILILLVKFWYLSPEMEKKLQKKNKSQKGILIWPTTKVSQHTGLRSP